jgi:signal transduction histidine kinase
MPQAKLAAAADHLGEQLQDQLQRLAALLQPHAAGLDRRFLARLRARHKDSRQRKALAAITSGAASRVIESGRGLLDFFEQVEYNGRRLAKLNLPPSEILQALREYDSLLATVVEDCAPAEAANYEWARQQLHFCITITLNNAYYQVREEETQAFYELFSGELESQGLAEVLQKFLATLARFCRAEAGVLFLLDPRSCEWKLQAGTGGVGSKTGRCPRMGQAGRFQARAYQRLSQPQRIRPASRNQDLLLSAGWHRHPGDCWSIPLSSGGRTEGVMQFAFSGGYEWLPRELELLHAAGEQCLRAAHKARLVEDLRGREEQVRRLAERLVGVEEAERRRISRELHDETGQSLLYIRLQLELLEKAAGRGELVDPARLGEARELTERTIIEIRRLISALAPSVLDQLGLAAAIRQLAARFKQFNAATVRTQIGGLGDLPPSTATMVYRLVQECLNNIGKHSQARHVNISARSADGNLKLEITDDGVGFNPAEALARKDTHGLLGLQERVSLLGGACQVRSAPGKGTRVSITLPLPREHGTGVNGDAKPARRARNTRFSKAADEGTPVPAAEPGAAELADALAAGR